MFEKELDAYYKAKKELRKKIIEYFDTLNEEIDICILIDEEELYFKEISNQVIIGKGGVEFDYSEFKTEVLIDILDGIIKYRNGICIKRI